MRSSFTFALAFSLLMTACAVPAFAGKPGDDTTARAVGLPAATTSGVVTKTADLGEFNRLLVNANLKNHLQKTTRAYTVFAPTNEAVQRIPASIRERMFVYGHPGLRQLVRTHLVAGTVDLAKLSDGAELKTLSGQIIRVAKAADGSILLDGVYRVTGPGRATANGMVYTIASVMAPR